MFLVFAARNLIPQGNDRPEELEKSWRPISLLSTLLKSWEKLVARRVEGVWGPPSGQHGFRRGCGTETSCVALATKLATIKNAGRWAAAMAADIDSAFDAVKIFFF